MMNKQDVLSAVKELHAAGQLSDVEVIAALRESVTSASATATTTESRRSLSLSKALYFIGGAVILIGIIILIVQNWEAMGFALQLIVTLGIAVASFAAGMLLHGREGTGTAARVFAGISGILFPIGVGVLLDHMGIAIDTPNIHMLVAAGLLLLFGVALFLLKDAVYTLFALLYGTWLYGAAVAFLMQNGGMYITHFPQYASMVLGFAYLLISHPLRHSSDGQYRRLAATLGFLGLCGVLGPAIVLPGIWEILFPFIVFGVMFASVYLHNGIYLKVGSIFLMAYLIKISAQYFSGSFGWPIALVLAGFMLMGVGYMTFYLNKKYIKTEGAVV